VADYRAAALAEETLRRGYIPAASVTFSAEALVGIMSDELRGFVVDLLRESGGEHLVVPHTIQVQPGVTEYRMPPRAVTNGVRRVSVEIGQAQVQLPQISPDALDGSSGVGGYFLRGPRLVLWPAPTQARTLRVDYLLRPSQLVTAGYGVVSGVTVAGPTATITVAWEGAPLTTGALDVVRASPPFDVLAVGATGVVAGTTVTVPVASVLEVPEAGDYVCRAGESPVPSVPLELHALLAQRTAWAALSSIGDAGANAAYERTQEMRAQCLALLSPRDIGARHYVMSGLRRGGLRWAGRWAR